MKKLLTALLLCIGVAVFSAGCNSEPPITKSQPGTNPQGAPELANTPGKNYSSASPEVQQKMAEMARATAAKR